MTNLYRHLIFLAIIFLASCGTKKVTEGVIEYEVTYPYLNTSKFMVMMMPSKMTMTFKDGKYKTVISKGKALRTEFIADCKSKKLTMGLTVFNKKISVELNEKEIKSMLREFPRVTYRDIKGSDTLAGFQVRKKEAVYEGTSSPPAEIWYTDEIEIENPNWCYPYNDIKGVLLQYDLERYGLRSHLKARKFKAEKVDDKEFQLSPDFKRVRLRDFEAEVKRILNI